MRNFAVESGDYAYAIGYAMKIKDVKKYLVKNTITKTMKIGSDIKNGNYKNKEIFKGIIQKISKENKGGFLSGTVSIKGRDIFSDSVLDIWFKNENLISWINNKPSITCPDLICITDLSYNGMYNRDLKIGMEVVVFGFSADKLWKSKEGLNIFSPKTFGFNIDYSPINLLE